MEDDELKTTLKTPEDEDDHVKEKSEEMSKNSKEEKESGMYYMYIVFLTVMMKLPLQMQRKAQLKILLNKCPRHQKKRKKIMITIT